MSRKMKVRVSYSTITSESVQDGDHADNGWIDHEYHERHETGDHDWPSLRDAMRFMADKCTSIETDWYPGIGTGHGFGNRWFSGTGCTDDCEGDKLEVCYDLHISDISDGTAHRLARVMASNGVYFANVRQLQRPVRRECKVCGGAWQHLYRQGDSWIHAECRRAG